MSRPYKHSLFACCSPCNLCLKAFCCPCVVAGENHYVLVNGSKQGYEHVNGWCVSWLGLACLGHFGWILQCLDRGDMNKNKGLNGNPCTNCLATCCCTCCELVQTSKELTDMTKSQDYNISSSGYQQTAPMEAKSEYQNGASNGQQSAYPPQGGYPPQGSYPSGGHQGHQQPMYPGQ